MSPQILHISPQGQITIPISWRRSLKLKKNHQLLANLRKIGDINVLTLVPEPSSWSNFSAGLGQSLWQNIDIDNYFLEERKSWGNQTKK